MRTRDLGLGHERCESAVLLILRSIRGAQTNRNSIILEWLAANGLGLDRKRSGKSVARLALIEMMTS